MKFLQVNGLMIKPAFWYPGVVQILFPSIDKLIFSNNCFNLFLKKTYRTFITNGLLEVLFKDFPNTNIQERASSNAVTIRSTATWGFVGAGTALHLDCSEGELSMRTRRLDSLVLDPLIGLSSGKAMLWQL